MNKHFIIKSFEKKYLHFILLAGSIFLIQCHTGSRAGGSNGSKAIRVLIVGGGSSHDFDKWYKQVDAETLQRGGLAIVTYTSYPDSILYYLPNMDVLYLCNNQPIKNHALRQVILEHVNFGKGLIVTHAALWYNWQDWPEYNLQLVSGGSRAHNEYGTFEVTVLNKNHPITKGVAGRFTLKDELYHLVPDPAGPGIEVLATASAEGSDKIYPSVFIVGNPKARIVGIALGHDGESHDNVSYQTILRNAVTWVANR